MNDYFYSLGYILWSQRETWITWDIAYNLEDEENQ